MTDEQLAAMLETVADELDSRGHLASTRASIRAYEQSLRPKRVYLWDGDSNIRQPHWYWHFGDARWNLCHTGYVLSGDIFADHKPESTDLAILKPRCIEYFPTNWNCKQ